MSTSTHATTMINFYIPTHYKNRFDILCRYHGSNRSSKINSLIQNFVDSEEDRLQHSLDEGKLSSVLEKFSTKHAKREVPQTTRPVAKPKAQPRWEESYIDDPFNNGTPW
jgi:metal-responsive CopG/Arc/MetJ family transcriptional regulator